MTEPKPIEDAERLGRLLRWSSGGWRPRPAMQALQPLEQVTMQFTGPMLTPLPADPRREREPVVISIPGRDSGNAHDRRRTVAAARMRSSTSPGSLRGRHRAGRKRRSICSPIWPSFRQPSREISDAQPCRAVSSPVIAGVLRDSGDRERVFRDQRECERAEGDAHVLPGLCHTAWLEE